MVGDSYISSRMSVYRAVTVGHQHTLTVRNVSEKLLFRNNYYLSSSRGPPYIRIISLAIVFAYADGYCMQAVIIVFVGCFAGDILISELRSPDS